MPSARASTYLTTKDVRVNGYPPLPIVLAHYDALPVLVQAVKRYAPAALFAEWEALRDLPRPPLRLSPITHEGELVLNPEVA